MKDLNARRPLLRVLVRQQVGFATSVGRALKGSLTPRVELERRARCIRIAYIGTPLEAWPVDAERACFMPCFASAIEVLDSKEVAAGTDGRWWGMRCRWVWWRKQRL